MKNAWRSAVVMLPVLLPPIVVTQAQTCSNGLAGYEASDVCCSVSCGQCGKPGCSSLDGGGDSCCTANVLAAGVLCSGSGAAPCIIDDEDEIAPTPSATTFSTSSPTASMELWTASPTSSPTSLMELWTASPTSSPTAVVKIPTASSPTSPPTAVTEIPTSSCGTGSVPAFRYASTSGLVGKGRLYAESEGCFTMTDIYNWRGTVSSGSVLSSNGPVYQLDDDGAILEEVGEIGSPVTGKWLLTAELYVTGGAVFQCKGASAGGDCDELRIQSTGSDDYYEVRGHGGSMYFEDTIVTSWDTPNKAPQETYKDGRSFLNCVSEFLTGDDCEGNAKDDKGECRMDLINSEFGYMGFHESESYGLTWKVRGYCKDKSNPEVFDTTNVYGDIIGCDIHHMYYGMYSYGHQGGVWTDNKMHDNWQYGFDPHDDSDYLTIARNEVYNNFNHGIIASKRCNNVKIYDNVVRDGGADAVGIFLHRSSDNAEVYGNTIYNMQDAGIALMESMDADIHDNSIDGAQYGIRMSLGSAGNYVHGNTFNDCSDYGLFTYEGSDPPDVSDNGRPYDNIFTDNAVTNTAVGVKLKRTDGMVVINNEFTGTTELQFFDAQKTVWSSNAIPSSGICVDNITSDEGESIDLSTFASSDGLPSDC